VSVISDLTMKSLQQAMAGLSQRRQVIQDNIANSETPGYLAGTVSFESSLKRAMNGDDPSGSSVSYGRSMSPTNLSGNNVNVDEELVALTENSLRSQTAIEALNAKYRRLRTVLS
jgi:flagellar basal-body rod protein FlgB